MATKTAEQVKREFNANGVTISRWAKDNDLSAGVVYEVLRGGRKGIRGQTHQAMKLLGILPSEAGEANTSGIAVR